MITFDVRSIFIRSVFLSCFLFLLFFTGQPTTSLAATGSQEFQNILRDSLEDLWSGRPFSPALVLRQQKLKTMLDSGAVKKSDVAKMMASIFDSLLNRHRTSRYILKSFPDSINALLSPHFDWEETKQVLWRTVSSAGDKNNPFLIKVATLAPPGTPWLNVPETLAIPQIEKYSDGKLRIQIYGGGVMGEDIGILEKMDDEQVDGCGCTALGVLASSPAASTLLLPRLFNNYEEVDYICQKFRKRLDKGFADNGYVLVALVDTGFFYFFSTKAITGLADIRSQNVMTWFGVVETTLYEELGINAMPVAIPDTVVALKTGRSDINLTPPAWMLGMQAYQYSSYYLKPPLVYSPAAVIISARMTDRLRDQWALSPTYAHNLQEVLVYEFNALEPEWKRQIRNYEAKSLRAFETKIGMQAMTFSPEDQQIITKASKAVRQKLSGTVLPEDLVNDIQQALEEYRASR